MPIKPNTPIETINDAAQLLGWTVRETTPGSYNLIDARNMIQSTGNLEAVRAEVHKIWTEHARTISRLIGQPDP